MIIHHASKKEGHQIYSTGTSVVAIERCSLISPNQPTAHDLPVKTTTLPKPPPEATDPPIDPPIPPLEIEMGNAVGTVSLNGDKNRNYDDCVSPTGSELPRDNDDDDNDNDGGEDDDADKKYGKKLSATRDDCEDDVKKLPARRALFSKNITHEDEKDDETDEYNTDDSHSEFKPKGDGSDEFDSDQNLDDTYDLFDSEEFLNDLMAENPENEVESKPKANRNSLG